MVRFAAFGLFVAASVVAAGVVVGVPLGPPLLVAAVLVSAAGGVLTWLVFVRPVVDRLRRERRTMARVADGDLRLPTGPDRTGDLGRLVLSLRRAIGEVQHVTAKVRQTGVDMDLKSKELLEAARRQASAVDKALASVASVGESLGRARERVDSVESFARDAAEALGQMTDRMAQVGRALDLLDQAALANREAVSQMTAGLESIAGETVELARYADDTDQFVSEVVRRIAEVRARAAETGGLARNVATTAEAGENLITAFVEGIRAVDDAVRRAQATIQALGKRSDEIGRIVDVIQEIADQTKLLSLNASIIAAQAGEQGQPFAVVADEIRGLAERTARSTREIGALVARVRAEVEGAVSVVDEGQRRAREGMDHAGRVAGALLAMHATAARAADSVDLTVAETAALAGEGSRVSELSRGVAARVRLLGEAAAAQAKSGRTVDDATLDMSRRASEARAEAQGQARMGKELTEAVARVAAAAQELRRTHAALARGESEISSATGQVSDDARRVISVADALSRAVGESSRDVVGLETQAFRFRIPPPRRGGRLTVGLASPHLFEATHRFDPLYLTDVAHGEAAFPFYSTLLRAGPGTEVGPDLAERWEVDADGRRHRLRLRAGVRFHDGVPLTAAEVKRAFERFLAPGPAAPLSSLLRDVEGAEAYAEGRAGDVAGIKVRSDLDLEFTLREPRPFFWNLLTLPMATIGRRAADGTPLGTGPFRVASIEPGRLVLDRYEGYHVPDQPHLDRVEVRFHYADMPAAIEACRRGEVDLVPVTRWTALDRIEDSDELSTLVGHSLSTFYVGFFCRTGPYADVRVRRAVRAALNIRDTVVRFHPDAELARTVVPPSLGSTETVPPPVESDPALARSLLREAGFPDGLDVTLFVTAATRFEENEHLFAFFLDAGFRLSVQELSGTEFTHRLRAGDLPFFRTGWSGDYPDPDAFLYFLAHSRGQGVANFGYANPELDRLCDEARASIDPGVRAALYERAVRILHDEVPLIPLFHEKAFAVARPGIEGIRLNLGSPRIRLQDVWRAEE